MGWGVDKLHRTGLLGGDYVSVLPPHGAVVVDMCSESRRVGSGARPESAERLAKRICKGLFAAAPVEASDGRAVLVAMFDCKERMHEARADLHRRRYKLPTAAALAKARAAGKVMVDGVAFERSSLPYTVAEVKALTAATPVVWSRLWASSHGKERSWELLYEGMALEHHRAGDPRRRFIMWLRGQPYEWPYDAGGDGLAGDLCNNTHGEGDQRVCEAARVLSVRGVRDILIQTIDTDMIIQILCTSNWGWKDNGPRGKLNLRLKNETISMGCVFRRLGETANERCTAAFWCLACGGVDYCRGLTRFGFTTKVLMAMVTARHSDVVRVGDGVTGLQTHGLMKHLCAMPRRNVKGRSVGEFVEELNSIIFCVVLFSGMSSKREPCGGPVMPAVPAFGEVDGATPFDGTFLTRVETGEIASTSVCHRDV